MDDVVLQTHVFSLLQIHILQTSFLLGQLQTWQNDNRRKYHRYFKQCFLDVLSVTETRKTFVSNARIGVAIFNSWFSDRFRERVLL
jgi:hypothetical protein